MVRDRKDPRKKEGNHMRVPLGGAMEIILNSPELVLGYFRIIHDQLLQVLEKLVIS